MFNKLHLKIGAKYMITKNEDVNTGLVNGACGTLVKVILKRKYVLRRAIDEKGVGKKIYSDECIDDDQEQNALLNSYPLDSLHPGGFMIIEDEKPIGPYTSDSDKLEHDTFYKQEFFAERLWLDFHEPKIGHLRRTTIYPSLYKVDQLTPEQCLTCVPMLPVSASVAK